MTQKDLNWVKANKEQIINEIAKLIEGQLDGDILDLYFYRSGEKMDYGFSKNQDTVMMMSAESISFVRDENDRIADVTAIEIEINNQIELSQQW